MTIEIIEHKKYQWSRESHGIRNVIISIDKSISRGDYKGNQQMLDEIVNIQKYITSLIPVFLEKIELRKGCKHDFMPSTYTIQKRIFCYMTVYEQKCKKCDYVEYHHAEEDHVEQGDKSVPKWCEVAKKLYYNNDI